MSTSTLKKELISTLATLSSIEGLENNKLFLLTPAGMIFGDLVTNEEFSNPNEQALFSVVSEVVKSYKEENGLLLDSPLPQNDGFVTLKNVSLQSASSDKVTRFLQMNIFFDQIVAVTVASL